MRVVTVGRELDNVISLGNTDMQVSRHHIQLTNDNGQYYITDLNSRNGTYVNGHKVQGTQRLQMRDVVRIGNTTIPWLMYFDDNYVRQLNSQRPKSQGSGNNSGAPAGGAVYVNPVGTNDVNGGNETNGMAVAGFVLAFIFPVLGIIFSSIGISKAGKLPDHKGQDLAVAGLVISIVNLIIWLILI